MKEIILKGNLNIELRRIGLLAGMSIMATPDSVGSAGAMYFNHFFRGFNNACVVYPDNYTIVESNKTVFLPDGGATLLNQFNKMKEKYPEYILFFRVGDSYQALGDDAVFSSKELGLELSEINSSDSLNKLTGFPYYSLDAYLPKLLKLGRTVAFFDAL